MQFYGDGDRKSVPTVKVTYPVVTACKLECVGHVQKRVGTRLRNLKKNAKGLGGKESSQILLLTAFKIITG